MLRLHCLDQSQCSSRHDTPSVYGKLSSCSIGFVVVSMERKILTRKRMNSPTILTIAPLQNPLPTRLAPSAMPLNLARCSQCLTLSMLILAILYQCEIPTDISSSDNSTFVVTKTAIFQRNRTFLYQFITDIPNYPLVSNLRYQLVVLA